jgi:hypothetical protein
MKILLVGVLSSRGTGGHNEDTSGSCNFFVDAPQKAQNRQADTFRLLSSAPFSTETTRNVNFCIIRDILFTW